MKADYAKICLAQVREAEREVQRVLREVKRELRENPYGTDFAEQSRRIVDAAGELLWAQSVLALWDRHLPRYVIAEERC